MELRNEQKLNYHGQHTDDVKGTPEDETHEDNLHHTTVRKFIEEPINSENAQPFQQEEIQDIVKKMTTKMAPGNDGISYDIIARVFGQFTLSVTTIYNKSLQQAHFPNGWKAAKIIPILKTGKEHANTASKYKPISLINVGGKNLEKLMINRITDHLHKN